MSPKPASGSIDTFPDKNDSDTVSAAKTPPAAEKEPKKGFLDDWIAKKATHTPKRTVLGSSAAATSQDAPLPAKSKPLPEEDIVAPDQPPKVKPQPKPTPEPVISITTAPPQAEESSQQDEVIFKVR